MTFGITAAYSHVARSAYMCMCIYTCRHIHLRSSAYCTHVHTHVYTTWAYADIHAMLMIMHVCTRLCTRVPTHNTMHVATRLCTYVQPGDFTRTSSVLGEVLGQAKGHVFRPCLRCTWADAQGQYVKDMGGGGKEREAAHSPSHSHTVRRRTRID